jgi:hypothetical protein
MYRMNNIKSLFVIIIHNAINIIQNIIIHCVDKTQSTLMLQHLKHIVNTMLYSKPRQPIALGQHVAHDAVLHCQQRHFK